MFSNFSMNNDPEKEIFRELSAKDWTREMKERAARKELEPWADLISEDDYLRSLEDYFGGLENLRGKKYLDVGAGFGSKLHSLLERLGVEITNVDISAEAIKSLNEKGNKGLVADAFKLAVKENYFDGAIAVDLINTSAAMDREDAEEIFGEIHRVVKKGGCFIQSHFGYYEDPIPKEEQLSAVESAGFQNVQLIENQLTTELAHLEPLAFIAERR